MTCTISLTADYIRDRLLACREIQARYRELILRDWREAGAPSFRAGVDEPDWYNAYAWARTQIAESGRPNFPAVHAGTYLLQEGKISAWEELFQLAQAEVTT